MKKTRRLKKLMITALLMTLALNLSIPVYADPDPEVEQDLQNADAPETEEEQDVPPLPNDIAGSNDTDPDVAGISVNKPSVNWIDNGQKVTVSANIYGLDAETGYTVQAYLGNKTQTTVVDGNTASSTVEIYYSKKDYEIYFDIKSGSGEVLAESEHIMVRRSPSLRNLKKTDFLVANSADDTDTGIIKYVGTEIHDDLVYFKQGSSETFRVNDGIITGLGIGTYHIGFPGYSDGYVYYEKSLVSLDVKKGNNGGSIPYVVRTSGDKNVSFSPKVLTAKGGESASIRIKPADETYYIDADAIRIEPANNVSGYSYASTGELFIEGITGDITIYVSVAEKKTVNSLAVNKISFNENGIYSEENPAIQTSMEIKALDKNGDPVANTTLYFRDDKDGTSFTNSKTTDSDGIAVFKHSYGINRESGATKSDHTALFGTNSSFEGVTATADIHLIMQLKKDLVLYEDQITGTMPGKNEGKVINVPAGYEIWTGTVHQGALTVGSGEWVAATNGEFTGLSSGQQAIRAGARVDGNTYYFASDYNYFFIPRLIRETVTEKETTESTVIAGDIPVTSGNEQSDHIVWNDVISETANQIPFYTASVDNPVLPDARIREAHISKAQDEGVLGARVFPVPNVLKPGKKNSDDAKHIVSSPVIKSIPIPEAVPDNGSFEIVWLLAGIVIIGFAVVVYLRRKERINNRTK